MPNHDEMAARLKELDRRAKRIADLEGENERLKAYIIRRSRDRDVQCCVSHELVATWERDKRRHDAQSKAT